MAENLDVLNLRVAQQGQILEQNRSEAYNSGLRFDLLLKMMEEKGVLAKGEFNTRWPQFLRTDVGVVGPDGLMEGTVLVHWYGDSGK